eukprot:Rhum_TRINITY_DN14692_c10_g1::Rhum_TRINITY_DN14692_c10_g1_i1::g.108815::m.108815
MIHKPTPPQHSLLLFEYRVLLLLLLFLFSDYARSCKKEARLPLPIVRRTILPAFPSINFYSSFFFVVDFPVFSFHFFLLQSDADPRVRTLPGHNAASPPRSGRQRHGPPRTCPEGAPPPRPPHPRRQVRRAGRPAAAGHRARVRRHPRRRRRLPEPGQRVLQHRRPLGRPASRTAARRDACVALRGHRAAAADAPARARRRRLRQRREAVLRVVAAAPRAAFAATVHLVAGRVEEAPAGVQPRVPGRARRRRGRRVEDALGHLVAVLLGAARGVVVAAQQGAVRGAARHLHVHEDAQRDQALQEQDDQPDAQQNLADGGGPAVRLQLDGGGDQACGDEGEGGHDEPVAEGSCEGAHGDNQQREHDEGDALHDELRRALVRVGVAAHALSEADDEGEQELRHEEPGVAVVVPHEDGPVRGHRVRLHGAPLAGTQEEARHGVALLRVLAEGGPGGDVAQPEEDRGADPDDEQLGEQAGRPPGAVEHKVRTGEHAARHEGHVEEHQQPGEHDGALPLLRVPLDLLHHHRRDEVQHGSTQEKNEVARQAAEVRSVLRVADVEPGGVHEERQVVVDPALQRKQLRLPGQQRPRHVVRHEVRRGGHLRQRAEPPAPSRVQALHLSRPAHVGGSQRLPALRPSSRHLPGSGGLQRVHHLRRGAGGAVPLARGAQRRALHLRPPVA